MAGPTSKKKLHTHVHTHVHTHIHARILTLALRNACAHVYAQCTCLTHVSCLCACMSLHKSTPGARKQYTHTQYDSSSMVLCPGMPADSYCDCSPTDCGAGQYCSCPAALACCSGLLQELEASPPVPDPYAGEGSQVSGCTVRVH